MLGIEPVSCAGSLVRVDDFHQLMSPGSDAVIITASPSSKTQAALEQPGNSSLKGTIMHVTATWMAICRLLLGFTLQGATEKNTDSGFATLLKETDGGPKKPEQVVIQSDTEWKNFIDSLQAEAAKKKLLTESIDFKTHSVVAVCEKSASILGEVYEKESGVQKVTIDQGDATVECNTVYSDHQDTKPHFRIHVIKISKSKKVTFKVSQKVHAG